MTTKTYASSVLALSGVLSITCTASPQQSGCVKDIDCKNDRICEMGMCISLPTTVSDKTSEGFEEAGEFDTGGGSECDTKAAMGSNAVVVDLPLIGDVTVTSWPNDAKGTTHAAGTTGECAWDLVASTDYNVYSPISGTVIALRNNISDACHYTYKCCPTGSMCKCDGQSGEQCGTKQDAATCNCSSLYALVAAKTCPTCLSSYGNYIVIEPDQAKGSYIFMAHLADNSIPSNIQSGTRVCQGEQVGRMGSTGNSTGRHVHFALTKETSGSFASIPLALRYKSSSTAMASTGIPRERTTIVSALEKQQCANSCTDFIRNGSETSADCGGGTCPPCADGLSCMSNRDCINGYCASGVCISAPQILVDNLTSPYDLAIDSDAIYWIENRVSGGALRKVQKSGGTVVTLSASLAEPTSVIVDSNYAYVLERNNGSNGMIHRIPLAGGVPDLVVSGLNGVSNYLIQAGNNLYWSDYILGTGGVIKMAPKGANVTSSIVAQGNGLLNYQNAIDTDGSYLYIRNDSNQILRFPVGGGSASVLGPTGTTTFLNAIRVSAGIIYFAGDTMIGSLPFNGGAMNTVLPVANGPRALAVDNGYVYFIDSTSPGGNVRRVSIGGGQVKTYYPQAGSIGIEVDATHVYWITHFQVNQGKVMRAPK